MSTVQINPTGPAATPTPPPFLTPWSVVEELDQIVRTSVEAIGPHFKAVDAAGYARLLQGLYHFTKPRQEQLQRASHVSEKPLIRGYFAGLAEIKKPSKYSEDLVKADLMALQIKRPNPAPACIGVFHRYWQSLGFSNELEFIGAQYIFETITKHLVDDVQKVTKALKLRERDTRFVHLFFETDAAQTHALREIVTEFSSTSRERLLAGARQASLLYKELFSTCLTGKH